MESSISLSGKNNVHNILVGICIETTKENAAKHVKIQFLNNFMHRDGASLKIKPVSLLLPPWCLEMEVNKIDLLIILEQLTLQMVSD
jgi:predicted ATPase